MLEPLYWADEVNRPGAVRCALLVLRVGLLIGLVDLVSAWLTLLERPPVGDSLPAMTRTAARLLVGFGRALLAPLLTLAATGAVLVWPRLRTSVGDALAWALDPVSHERVLDTLRHSLESDSGPLILIGHSQGGSIAAALAPRLRAHDRDVRLITLGSGHGLLSAMGTVLPRWSLLKSVLCWSSVLAVVTFAAIAILETVGPEMRPLGALLELTVQLSGYAWLTSIIGAAPLHQLLHHGTNIAQSLDKDMLRSSLPLTSATTHGMIASSVLAVLVLTMGVGAGRRLHKAALADVPGIDVVATHDLVAATMLHLTAGERLRRVGQSGSILFDHTSYLRNAWSVLPMIAEQIEQAGGLAPSAPAVGDGEKLSAGERDHRARLTMDAWSRPLAMAAILATVGWFADGRVAPALWIGAAIVLCAIVWATITAADVRRLNNSGRLAATVPETPGEADGRSSNRWQAMLALMATPLLGGAALAFTTPLLLQSLERHPAATALTVAAFPIGVALCVVSWRSAFGVQRESVTAVVLVAAAAVWLLHGTSESVGMTVLMLALARWAYRRHETADRSDANRRAAPSP